MDTLAGSQVSSSIVICRR